LTKGGLTTTYRLSMGDSEMSLQAEPKGLVNHLPRVRVLYSVAEIILVLGDTEEVAHATNATWGAVKQWRRKNRIPHQYEGRIRGLLMARRFATVPTLFTAPDRMGWWDGRQRLGTDKGDQGCECGAGA